LRRRWPHGSLCPERAKSSSILAYVRLLLTLELRRELAEKLSEQAIRKEVNIHAACDSLLEAGARRAARAAS